MSTDSTTYIIKTVIIIIIIIITTNVSIQLPVTQHKLLVNILLATSSGCHIDLSPGHYRRTVKYRNSVLL